MEAWERKRELKGVEIRRLGNENAPIIRLGFEKRFFQMPCSYPLFLPPAGRFHIRYVHGWPGARRLNRLKGSMRGF